MDCHEVKNSLSALLDSDLPQEDESQIRYHLESCGACKKEMETLQATWNLLGQWNTEEPASDFEQKFWAKIAEVETHERPNGWLDFIQTWFFPQKRWRVSWVPLGSLATAMLLIMAWIFQPTSTETPRPAVVHNEQTTMVEMLTSLNMLEHKELIENMELLENFELLLNLEEMYSSTSENG